MTTDQARLSRRRDTMRHIGDVAWRLRHCATDLQGRGDVHDASKLEDPERAAFEGGLPHPNAAFGSDEYHANLAHLGPALAHHYAANRHHPEHHENGVAGMTLLDLVEMLCDWAAAGSRFPGTRLEDSIRTQQARFGFSDELCQVFLNSISEVS